MRTSHPALYPQAHDRPHGSVYMKNGERPQVVFYFDQSHQAVMVADDVSYLRLLAAEITDNADELERELKDYATMSVVDRHLEAITE